MNIDKIIAGPDPVTNCSTLGTNDSDAEATYAKVMARVAGRRATNPRVRRRVFAGTGVFATAAAAVTMVTVSFGSVGPATPVAGAAVLSHLATHIKANATMPLPGDATLVLRTQSYPNGTSNSEADLYTDSGQYFFSPTESGLSSQVSTNNDQADGLYVREIAAAKLAATGNVQAAAQDMDEAAIGLSQSVGSPPPAISARIAALKAAAANQQSANLFDSWVWEDSLGAMIAGSGDPQVRAGVLQILATLPDVTISSSTSGGQSTDVLTAGAAEEGPGYSEQLTINATTGIPVSFVGGVPGQAPVTTVNYEVSRVTTSDVASGKL
jgi:hypothetical protein